MLKPPGYFKVGPDQVVSYGLPHDRSPLAVPLLAAASPPHPLFGEASEGVVETPPVPFRRRSGR
jgi:hypothetical protein